MTTSLYANINVIKTPLPKDATEKIIQKTLSILQTCLSPTRCKGNNTSLSIRLDSNEEVQTLNNNFRGKNMPTNVLSFPTDNTEAYANTYNNEEQAFYLGDIIIATNIVAKEAKESNISFTHHLQHMIIHGTLHLFEFNHILDIEADIMENTEINILAKLDISNPYD